MLARTFGTRGHAGTDPVISFVIRWLILAVAVWIAAEIVDGVTLDGWFSTLAVALILGLLNVWVKPILETIALPLTKGTLGLFLIVINTALFALTARIAVEFEDIHFAINGIPGDFFWEGFKNSLLGAIVVAVVGYVLGLLVAKRGTGRWG